MFKHINRIRFLTFTLLLVSALLLPIRVATAQLKATFEGHTDHVWSVAFSPNGNILASASWDQTVRLWNVDTGQLLHTLIEHEDVVNSVAFSPDGRTLASGSWDGTIRLWNPHDGQLKRTLIEREGGVTSVAFSPDGRTLASGSADQTIRLWDTRTWRLKRTITGHTHIVDVVVFSPDGGTLASGSRDTTIHLWNPNNGQHKGTLTGHTSDVIRMAFSPDGATLGTGSLDQTVRLWDPHTGKLKNTLPDSTGRVNPVVFSPDGDTLLTGGSKISLWDPQTGEIKGILAANIGNAVSIVFSPDGQMVASGSEDNAVRLWEFNAPHHEGPSITTNGMVRLVYFVPNDRPNRPERVTAFRQLIRDTQEYFADQMEHHGFGRKTVNVETSKNGEPVVHRINGKFNENYYNKHDQKNPEEQIWKEIVEHFDDFQHIYFIAIDVSAEALGRDGGACGLGGAHYFTFHDAYGFVPFASGGLALRHRYFTEGNEVLGGSAIIPASGPCFEDNRGFLHPLRATIHELAHALGLGHDLRDGENTDSATGGKGFILAKCEAEWLSVSRFFNTGPIPSNETGKIELLSVQAYNKDVINLRFKVTDPDGLHQAQLLVPVIYEGTGEGPDQLFDCKHLNGKTQIIKSAVRTSELADRILLQIVDVNGNITWATLPIQLDAVPRTRNAFDVNNDRAVDIADLKSISSRLGQRGKNPADINEDKVVNINDLLLVAASLSSASQSAIETFTTADIQKWLTDAKKIGIENEYQRRGVVFLQRLLTELGGEIVGNIATNRTVVNVPTTGTDLAIDKPPELTRDNFTIGPGEFAILAHNGQQAIIKQVNFKTYDAYWGIGNNSRDIPNLESFFQDGGRIELISHITANPLPSHSSEAEFGDIVISEIMWGLDGTSSAKQYIELYNASAHAYSFADADVSLRFSTASEEPLPDGAFPPLHNPDVRNRVIDRVSNAGWKVPGRSGNISENKPLISMYRAIDYTTGDIPDGTLASSWKASTGRVNLSTPNYGTPGAKHLPPVPVVLVEASQRPPMYWVDAEAGTLHRLTGDKVENIVTNVQNATSLAVDMAGGKFYWTEKTSERTGTIKQANLDGSNVKLVKDLTSVPLDIALDTVGGKLYLTNSWGKIQCLNLDGSNFQSNLITDLQNPNHLVLDTARGKVYWTEQTGKATGTLRRANLDGTDIQLVKELTSAPHGIAVDAVNQKLYLTNSWGKVQRLNVDGSNFQSNLITDLDAPKGVSVDVAGRKIYWTEQGSIRRADLNGENIEDVVTGLGVPTGIVLGIVPTTAPAAPGIVALPPDATVLLPNYPNPFNPETWIPYQLSKPTEVTLHIYSVNGTLVRTLDLGHQSAGVYHSRTRAAYWDGKNETGEAVASGLYFYTFTAGDFTATRRMLILK